jgi:uncharacterized protein YjbJ (UPF0337 family)
MDKDRVKGAVNDAAGRAKRQVGEWTGNTNAQVEGSLQQAKGKVQKAVGTMKDAARDAKTDLDKERERDRANELARENQNANEREHAHSSAGKH